MVVNPNWPVVVTQFSTADAFDPLGIPVWNAFNPQPEEMTGSAGRQYELDLVQAGEATYTLFDQAEALNPANTAGPYYPNIKPLRQIIDQAMWPPPLGGAVNLLNAGAGVNPQLGTGTAGYDPGFESYSLASTVPWITAVGGTAPVVGNGAPHSGTQNLVWTVSNGTTGQGASFPVPCIPGQQYTASAWVRQSSASTQQLVVGGLTAVDRFQRTGALGGSVADSGQTWTINGGVAGDYTTTAGAGSTGTASISSNTVNVVRFATLGVAAQDSDFRFQFTVPAVAVGGSIFVSALSRYTGTTTHYRYRVTLKTTGTLDAEILVFNGSGTSLGTTSNALNYAAGSTIWVRCQTIGNTQQMKVWLDGTTEPTAWTKTVTDATLTGAGQLGYCDQLQTGNTNGTVVISRGPFLVANYSISGTTTTTTGAYVRLTATFTATQPLHTMAVTTIGTVVAGTVLLDDIQVEPGASASANSSTGPVIYGVFSGFIERWPRSWKDSGVRGQAKLTAVDALAVLAKQFLGTEYRNAVLAKAPAYYWTLGEPQGTANFAEISTNNGPSLTRRDGWFGPGPTFNAGTQTNIPGDLSGTGLATDQPTTGALNLPVSVAGTPVATQPVAVGQPSGNYGITVSAWVVHPTIPSTSDQRIFLLISSQLSSTLYQAIWQVSYPNLSFGGNFGNVVTSGDQWADGKPHLFVHTLNVTGGNSTNTIWVDGVQAATNTLASVNTPLGTVAQIGGAINPAAPTTTPGLNGGVYSHFAVWNRILTSTEIADLWSAGQGYINETSGTRVKRYLAFKWIGPTAIDTGQSTMGVSNLALNTSVLDACQSVTTSENGRFVVDANNGGAPTFQSRTRQYLNTTPKWILGEQELPYEEDIAYDFDDQQIYNDVQVTRVGGVTAFGGTQAAIAASQHAAGQNTYPRTINVLTDSETQNAADWIFAGHNQAVQRLATLTIRPSSNPALWPMALGARQGDRITVHRRTSAGTPMVADFFIERVEHSRKVSDTSLDWTVSYQASPAALTRQPWLLGDLVYGALDTTTVLAY